MNALKYLSLIAALNVLLAAGCATDTVSTREPDLSKHPDVAGKTPVVFDRSASRVRAAALEVLGSMNCLMKAEAQSYLKGRCPTGESVEVFLKPAGENVTHVWVDTDFSYVGLLGQHNQNDAIVDQIRKTLSRDLAPKL